MSTFLNRLAGAVSLALAAVWLSACVVSSASILIDDAELATPLPATFAMFPYKEDPTGYVRAADAPGPYTMVDATYVADDGSMTLRFVPLVGDTYLLTASGGQPGALYGTATITGSIVAINMILGEGSGEAISAAIAGAPPEIASDIHSEDGGVVVKQRATLDYLVGLIADGRLPTSPLVAYIGETASVSPPALIVARDGVLQPGP